MLVLVTGCWLVAKKTRRQRPVRARLWRFRRSPLRRTSDFVEAWLLLIAWIVEEVLGGATAGALSVMVADRGLEEDRSGRREVVAVLLEKARDVAPTHADVSTTSATGRWTMPDGRTHTGRAAVPVDASAGTRLPVWTNSRGAWYPGPLPSPRRFLRSSFAGMDAATVTGGAVWGSAQAARALLDRRLMRQWALVWESVGTRRGGRIV